jgi:predicted nucleic acid-binding protein
MGEVQLRGPWVASSYYELPEEKDKWTGDGWFRTGDVGTVDAQGYLTIVDRTKDLIKSGGEWISSVDLENALMAHPDVREAAVIAVPHPKWQERPVAVVVLREGATTSSESLREFLAGKFAKWQLTDAFVFVDELLDTSTGVVSLQVLQEYFVTVTRKLHLDPRIARRKIELLAEFDVAAPKVADILAAIDLHRLHGFSFWDALVLRAAKQAGCRVVFSEDMQEACEIDGVHIVDPFL